jgi:hypothetical protein
VKYLGIDPGKSGGWAILSDEGDLLRQGESVEDLRGLSRRGMSSMLEKVGASPQMSRSAAFAFGAEYGKWLGFLDNVELVTPQKWQYHYLKNGYRHLLEGVQGPARKRNLRAIAQDVFPDVKVTLQNADALLIANYHYETNE